MDETRQQQELYYLFVACIILMAILEAVMYVEFPFSDAISGFWNRFHKFMIYRNIFLSKLATLFIIFATVIGSRPQQTIEFNARTQVAYPLICGTFLFWASAFLIEIRGENLNWTHLYNILYLVTSLVGTFLMYIGATAIFKYIRAENMLKKDPFNYDNESFKQSSEKIETPFSINIPMEYYYQKKWNSGWLSITNPFRGTLLIGVPGCGKSFSIVNSYIRQHSAKGFALMVYDFKFPDLAKVAYYNYLMNRKKGIIPDIFGFNVICFSKLEYSRRINPLKREYIATLEDALETASAVVDALQRGGAQNGGGSEQFFSDSAKNFLACCIYFFSRYDKEIIDTKTGEVKKIQGIWSDLPHVLAFMNRTYEQIFTVLQTLPELESLLSPFRSALEKKAFEQLEGQIGTVKVSVSRLATPGSYWIFSGDDFSLKISDKRKPSYLIIANDPDKQDINSALNALVLNRMVRLINSKNNLPCSLILDEFPTIFFHKISNLIATARSNRVSVLLGLQELPQLKTQYGDKIADEIVSIIGNLISGPVGKKETLELLVTIFGKNKQMKKSISVADGKTTVSYNENLDNVIPASKIASLPTGSLVARIVRDFITDSDDITRENEICIYNCRTKLDLDYIKEEEKKYCDDMPRFYNFGSIEDREAILAANFKKINDEVLSVIKELAPLTLPAEAV